MGLSVSRGWRVLVAGIAVLGLLAGFASCGAHAADRPSPQTEFGRELAAWPTPDLDKLAERIRSGQHVELLDVVKLREVGDAKAVPVLVELLKGPFSYAAAQALFCIGTPEAHEALRKHVSSGDFSASEGIRLTFEYEMPEPAASRFIEQYCLTNSSDDVALELEVKQVERHGRQHFDFTITARNTSDETLEIRAAHQELPWRVCIRSKDGFAGYFVYMFIDVIGMPVWVELDPGETHRETYSVSVDRVDASVRNACADLPAGAELMLSDDRGFFHAIAGPGSFDAYAILDARPLSDDERDKEGVDNPWSGRAVSKPVTIEVAAPVE
jgi:hypothetical protein